MCENKADNNKKKDNRHGVRIGLIIFFLFDTLVAILFFILFPRYCSKPKQTNSSLLSSSHVPFYDCQTLNNKLISLVTDQLEIDGFDSDSINRVIAISYKDNYPNNFDMSITVKSDNSVYTYNVSNCTYPEDKQGYDNFVSYLLKDNVALNADIELSKYDTANEEVINTDKVCKYVIYKSISNNKYLSGFYLINDEYRIYQNIEIVDITDPFNKPCTEVVKKNDVLYDYYTYLANGNFID